MKSLLQRFTSNFSRNQRRLFLFPFRKWQQRTRRQLFPTTRDLCPACCTPPVRRAFCLKRNKTNWKSIGVKGWNALQFPEGFMRSRRKCTVWMVGETPRLIITTTLSTNPTLTRANPRQVSGNWLFIYFSPCILFL